MATASGEAITVVSGNAGLFPSGRGREAASTGSGLTSSTDKEESPEFRDSMTLASPRSHHTSLSQLSGSSSSFSALTSTVDTAGRLGLQLGCNSAGARMRVCTWCSALSPVATGDKDLLQGTHGSFQMVRAMLGPGIPIPELTLFFLRFVQHH